MAVFMRVSDEGADSAAVAGPLPEDKTGSLREQVAIVFWEEQTDLLELTLSLEQTDLEPPNGSAGSAGRERKRRDSKRKRSDFIDTTQQRRWKDKC